MFKHCYMAITSLVVAHFVLPDCELWEGLCDLLQKINNKPLVLHIVSKLSAASDVSRDTTCQ